MGGLVLLLEGFSMPPRFGCSHIVRQADYERICAASHLSWDAPYPPFNDFLTEFPQCADLERAGVYIVFILFRCYHVTIRYLNGSDEIAVRFIRPWISLSPQWTHWIWWFVGRYVGWCPNIAYAMLRLHKLALRLGGWRRICGVSGTLS